MHCWTPCTYHLCEVVGGRFVFILPVSCCKLIEWQCLFIFWPTLPYHYLSFFSCSQISLIPPIADVTSSKLWNVPKLVLSYLGRILMLKTLLPETGFPAGEQFLCIWAATLYCTHHYWQELWSLPQTFWLAELQGAFWSSSNNTGIALSISLLLLRGEGRTLAIRAWRRWFKWQRRDRLCTQSDCNSLPRLFVSLTFWPTSKGYYCPFTGQF